MTSRYKSCFQIGHLEHYILSAVVCDVCYRSGYNHPSEDYLGVRKREPALQCRRQICAPDSSSLKPGSGATEGVLDEGVLGRTACYLWAGLMGCEDMKAEDCTRVRIGPYLAPKASLATDYEDSLLCKPTSCNPRSLRCLYKPESIVRIGQIHYHIHIG